MNASTELILNSALALPNEDRLEVAEALIVSLQSANEPPFDESWREVINRRSAELRSGQVTPIPWEQVQQRAREKTRG